VPRVVTNDGTLKNTVMKPLTKPISAEMARARTIASRIGTW
jgi:hypothetical protein